jgi:adenylosuccinate lyase
MIARYSREEMSAVWEDRRRYQVWLRVELEVCRELAAQGLIPRKHWSELRASGEKLLAEGGVDPKRVDHHEAKTRHDVIAFTTAVAERIGPVARYIHFGLTSSDVVDTSLSLIALEAGDILLEDVRQLLIVLKKQAIRYKKLPTIGRSHGIFAEPTSFGLKFLGWYAEWKRNEERLARALEGMRFGKLSGAVGVNAHWAPAFEKKVLKRLGLGREPVATQVIPRDRHAELLLAVAQCGSSLERVSVELRHLQRSEVGEVLESFRKGQKGSSAMPHKRNPISSENLTGCARLLRAYAQAGLENVALWHERDISHSSVERIALPDAFILLDYALARLTGLVENVVVREDRVAANLEAAGSTVFSGHFLLELVKAGATREDAYAWVQQCALASFETPAKGAEKGDFVELLASHPQVSRLLKPAQIRQFGSLKHQLRNVDEIYREVL